MQILFITHFFPPKHNAGTENYTLGLAKAFLSKGHSVQVLCAEDWESGEQYWNDVTTRAYDGIPVHRIHLNWIKASNPNKILYDSPQVEEWLYQYLQNDRVDLVHITSTTSLGVGIIRSAKRLGIPVVLTLMDFWFVCPSVQLLRSNGELCDGKTTAWECQSCMLENSNMFQKLKVVNLPDSAQSMVFSMLSQVQQISKIRGMRGMLLNMEERKELLPSALLLPDIILTHSKIVQKMIGQNIPVQIEVLSNGQDLPWMNKSLHKKTSNFLRFGYIGQIIASKGVHVLVDAFQKANINEQAQLIVWGDLTRNPSYAEKLQTIAGENQSIIFHGRFDRDCLESVLADIDVLVVPSLWYENAPLVIQEAFAAKVPVIATNLGGMAEAVSDGIDGLLFNRGDALDLARILNRFVQEPNLIEALKRNIPNVKTVDEEVSELLTIYQRLIAGEEGDG